jgi:hypothetical protein
MTRFSISGDWKDKVRGACECFIGGDNKLHLNHREKICEYCDMWDLKKLLLGHRKKRVGTTFLIQLMKMNQFTRKELQAACLEMLSELDFKNLYRKAVFRLEHTGYIYFITDLGIVKVYHKTKV